MEKSFSGTFGCFRFVTINRLNLDYLVDEMCSILKSIRQLSNNEDHELGFLTQSVCDDRIIRVVGAVFFEIQQPMPTQNEYPTEDDIQKTVMLLRDLIRDSLDVIDVLCTSSTNYAENKDSSSTFIASSRNYKNGQVVIFFSNLICSADAGTSSWVDALSHSQVVYRCQLHLTVYQNDRTNIWSSISVHIHPDKSLFTIPFSSIFFSIIIQNSTHSTQFS